MAATRLPATRRKADARKIKSVPTVYGGIEFRSRLEARWAVFFDTLGIEWRYEHEWYDLPSGKYLPDFWLPGEGMIVEIKPAYDEFAMRRLAELHEQNDGNECYLFTADDLRVPTIHIEDGGIWRAFCDDPGKYEAEGRQWWGYCEVENRIFLALEAIDEVGCHPRKNPVESIDDYTHLHDAPLLRTAFQTAQRYRFGGR